MAVRMCFHLILNYLLFIVLIDVSISYASDYEDSRTCKISSYMSGKCTVASQCGIVVSALKKGRPHRLKRCGFTEEDDPEEIVCCPTTSIMIKLPESSDEVTTQDTDTRGNLKRKCVKYCDDISTDSMKNVIFHIIGGDAAEDHEFPHMAVVGYPGDNDIEWNCGASIISKNFVLTAAHCFKQIKPTKIRVGVTRLDDPTAQDFSIKNIIVHKEYSPASKHNDIALVEIDGEIKFNTKVYPACLYPDDDDPLGLIITGWGKTSVEQEDDRSIILQKAPVVAADLDQCNTTYATRSMGMKTIDRTQMCASTPPGRAQTDACWGDSGGPCQIKNKLGTFSIVGVISYGQACGSRVPGVYTRVQAYLDWIERNVWPN